jgi:hypothetical protein
MRHEPMRDETRRTETLSDEIGRWLQALPTLPAPARLLTPYWQEERQSLRQLTAIGLLLLLPAAWLMQQAFAAPISEIALQATPYPIWESLLHRAQEALQMGWQLVQEVLG